MKLVYRLLTNFSILLLSRRSNEICLDWRQICNGIVDCDYGKDESNDFCLQMETNQCDSKTEFRCRNGLCIPITMKHQYVSICADQSDKFSNVNTVPLYSLSISCYDRSRLECDEINHGWKRFSCHNDQSIFYEDLTLKIFEENDRTCTNNYHLIYLRKLFSTNKNDQCWKSMICLIGLNYLYSDTNCPNEFYFPSNSIV